MMAWSFLKHTHCWSPVPSQAHKRKDTLSRHSSTDSHQNAFYELAQRNFSSGSNIINPTQSSSSTGIRQTLLKMPTFLGIVLRPSGGKLWCGLGASASSGLVVMFALPLYLKVIPFEVFKFIIRPICCIHSYTVLLFIVRLLFCWWQTCSFYHRRVYTRLTIAFLILS